MDRFCLDCSALLIGRADKKFCDDHCRTSFNNRLKAEDQGSLRKVNHILKRNRTILKHKNPTGTTKVKRDSLLLKGFNFNYHTNIYATRKGQTYFFCYEYGYLPLANEEFLLVKRDSDEGHFAKS